MSTDLVLVASSVIESFREKLISVFQGPSFGLTIAPVRTAKSAARVRSLITDAKSKGAKVTQLPTTETDSEDLIPATILENIDPTMSFYTEEAFGPLLGVIPFSSLVEAKRIIESSRFGLSSAIFTKNHFEGLRIAKSLKVGAVHINGATVHDESTLPHGGHGDSGWGRFGAGWGLEEFIHTKTIILNE